MSTSILASSPRALTVEITDDTLTVDLDDGRTLSVPIGWYPRLAYGTAEERANHRISGGGYGIHWPDIDEDLSTEGLLRGAPTAPQPIDARK